MTQELDGKASCVFLDFIAVEIFSWQYIFQGLTLIRPSSLTRGGGPLPPPLSFSFFPQIMKKMLKLKIYQKLLKNKQFFFRILPFY